jgi:carbamoyl-phosphate synthase small subunit
MNACLVLEDGATFAGVPFGWPGSVAGEVVFNTGMVGYPECFTDPSYAGQILVLTYPLVGNYGVPPGETPQARGLDGFFESGKVQLAGLVVSENCVRDSHWNSRHNLDVWLRSQRIPALAGVDTRALTQHLRTAGAMLGKVVKGDDRLGWRNPNEENLVAGVSIAAPERHGNGDKHVVVVDCGCKNNIVRSLIRRNLCVTVVPWNHPLDTEDCDGVVLSNGPGDPKQCGETIHNVRRLLARNKPVFGICLGNQILALAAGAETYKLKYGHRSQNQPCVLVGSKRCFITSQNHGYAVDERTLPGDWLPWFFNANDGTNEGIRHRTKPFRSVQFHPEATPGPCDTEFLFDEFVEMLVNS